MTAQRHLSDHPSATRMRWLRDRRRRGFRCVTLEIGRDDIAGLIARGFLDRLQQDNPDAVTTALCHWLDNLALPSRNNQR